MRIRKWIQVAATILLAGLFGQPALFAQDPSPDVLPGYEARDFERVDPERFRPRPEVRIEVPEQPEAGDLPETEVEVAGYRLVGNLIFIDEVLLALIDELTGTVTFADVVEAADRITNHYRDAGYIVARAYVPEQTLEDGIVELGILEGVLGDLVLTGDSPVDSRVLLKRFERLGQTGVINQPDLEYGALLVNDLPGMSAGVSLRPGLAPGTTDVVVDSQDEGTWDYSLDLNNAGSEITGEYRLGARIHANNLFDSGDRLTFRPMITDSGDTLFGSIGYDMPVLTPATRMGTRVSYLESELGQEFSDLEIENRATTGTLFLSHAFVRSRNANVNGRLAYEHRRLERDFGALADISGMNEEVADYRLNVLEAGIGGDNRDVLGGGGINSGYASVRRGLTSVDDEDAGSLVSGDTRIDGVFTALQVGGQRLQYLSEAVSLLVQADAQYSREDLDASEQMGLGGPHAVRAYRPGEALGDRGLLLRSELRFNDAGRAARADWMDRLEPYLLLDAGATRVNDTAENFVRSGWGGGLRLGRAQQYYVDLTIANRLGNQESIVDQPDDDRTQYWLQAVYWF